MLTGPWAVRTFTTADGILFMGTFTPSVYRRRVALKSQFEPMATRKSKPTAHTTGAGGAVDRASNLRFGSNKRPIGRQWLPRSPPSIVGPFNEHTRHPLTVERAVAAKAKGPHHGHALYVFLAGHRRKNSALG